MPRWLEGIPSPPLRPFRQVHRLFTISGRVGVGDWRDGLDRYHCDLLPRRLRDANALFGDRSVAARSDIQSVILTALSRTVWTGVRCVSPTGNDNDSGYCATGGCRLIRRVPTLGVNYFSALDSSNCQNLGFSCRSWSSEIGNLLRKKKSLSEFLLRMQRTLMISAFRSK